MSTYMLDGKRIVHFLLVIIDLFFTLALTAEAPLSEICRSGQFEHKFQVDGDVACNPSVDR